MVERLGRATLPLYRDGALSNEMPVRAGHYDCHGPTTEQCAVPLRILSKFPAVVLGPPPPHQ